MIPCSHSINKTRCENPATVIIQAEKTLSDGTVIGSALYLCDNRDCVRVASQCFVGLERFGYVVSALPLEQSCVAGA